MKYKIIGIRPGEKLHKLLYSVDDSNIVIEFKIFIFLELYILELDELYNKVSN